MKKIINIKFVVILISVFTLATSCSEDFIDIPAEGAPTLGNYYDSDEKLDNAANGLYGLVWFNINKSGFYGITDVISGNMYAGPYNEFGKFTDLSFTNSQAYISESWKSCYAGVANANIYINNLPLVVGPNVSEEALNNAMGECHFIRAFSYFMLVRLWGNVPIIEDASKYTQNFVVPSNPVEDVYKFIEEDLLFAIDNLRSKTRGANYAENAHVSSGSAKAMLAKVYLYQKRYEEARILAKEVIDSNEFKLMDNFSDLFLQVNNNNEESIFAWQWNGSGTYFDGNFCNTLFAPENRLVETTYSGQMAPSQDLINNVFEPSDLRRKETFMLPGDFYPNLTFAETLDVDSPLSLGYTFEINNGFIENGVQNSGAGLKKYVIGKENLPITGKMNQQFNGACSMNSYMMRYAELLLIHAEATIGSQSGSTSDADALASFNAVHTRAGLQPVASITFEDVFKERRAELACEGDYYFDLGRLPFNQAKAILEGQNRGDATTEKHITISATNLLLPYPEDDLIKNPKLIEVEPYDFNQ